MARKTGETTMDHAAVAAAVRARKSWMAGLPHDRLYGRPDVDIVLEVLGTLPETVEATFGNLDEVGPAHFVLWRAVADVVEKQKVPVVSGDLKIKQSAPKVLLGDVTVKGNLRFATDVYVLGDLVVGGVIEDDFEHTHLLVTGSIRARGIKCGARLWSGGSVQTEVLVVALDGHVHAHDGIRAELVVVEDDASQVAKVEATTYLKGTEMMSKLARLRAVLAPDCFAVDGDDEPRFDREPLFEHLRAGKPWAARAGSGAAPHATKKREATARSVRRFELVGGSASKFWEIGVEGTSFTTRYGRIGTDGQTTTKSFPSTEKAHAEAAKLVAEKTRKGYAEK